jgi:class 3 adenylate cyclase
MTFRARLLLAMIAVVTLATVASLLIAQRQSAATYRAATDALLARETAAFQREQDTHHRNAAQDVARLAKSVRLFAAIEAADPAVYDIARDELRIGEFDFFRLLDARGRLIEPPAGGRAGRLDPARVRGALVPASARPGQVQLGFVEVFYEADAVPYRVLAAPIEKFGSAVGSLVLGQRIELASADAVSTGLRSALRLGDRLVGGDVPGGVRTALTRALATAADSGEIEGADGRFRYQRFALNAGSTYPPAELVAIASLARFDAEQRRLALRLVSIGAVALLLAALFATALSRQLARPMADLVRATRAIRDGRYEHALPPSSTREMNTLAEAFNDMAAGLALRDRYRSVLQQVTDPRVADELVAGRIQLGGELREVTVMFCDIRGYTPLSVGRAPAAVIEILNAHLGAMARVVQAHGGVINQFAGDSVMALFGAPHSYGDDAHRAVACACAMIRERARLNEDAAEPIRVGIGIATGAMVAGCIGAEHRSDYTVVGERVNLAARLTSSAGPGEVVVDAETQSRVGEAFATHMLAPLTLKGFSGPVRAYRVDVPAEAAP